MAGADGSNKKKVSPIKLILFGVLSAIVCVAVALLCKLWPVLFPSAWNMKMQEGGKIWNSDRPKAKELMNDAIRRAEQDHAPAAELIWLHRSYAQYLYGVHDYTAGDAQIEQAVSACPKPPAPNSQEADQLTHAYQDRGWTTFNHHLKDPKVPFGDIDQEHSVEVAERAFGPEHEQTTYKMPTLALIYSEMGQKDKAHKTMERAFRAAAKPAAAECGWFVYAMDARIKISEQDYKAGVQSFVHGLAIAQGKSQTNRLWEEFEAGIARHKAAANTEFARIKSLFEREKYEELDMIADKLIKAQTQYWSGRWELDAYYDAILSDDIARDREYQQCLFDIKNWMKQRPQSANARIALAEAYVNYAWFARGSGSANTVDKQGWKLFRERLAKAKATLNADPKLTRVSPHAFREYASVALGQGMDQGQFGGLLSACHKSWPTYYNIDQSAVWFYLPRWYGVANESESYIQSRADALSGAKGDELYAQLVAYIWKYLDAPLTKNSTLKWERVKAGFKEIFKDFPTDIDARMAYVRLCFVAKDLKAMETAFDGFHQ